jgi:hypothetical protein
MGNPNEKIPFTAGMSNVQPIKMSVPLISVMTAAIKGNLINITSHSLCGFKTAYT